MIEVQKYTLESWMIVGALPQHNLIKQSLVEALNEQTSDSLLASDNYYSDSINRVDWSKSSDFTRPWTLICKPWIDNFLDLIAQRAGYQKAIIEQIWFQQYLQEGTHGWHTHGSNYTGVYYLELDEQSPKTEIIEPANQSEKFIPSVKEGDILLFPSYTIHRAPPVQNNQRKTIISFNFILDLINPDLLKVLNN
jgi:hypothetical protein